MNIAASTHPRPFDEGSLVITYATGRSVTMSVRAANVLNVAAILICSERVHRIDVQMPDPSQGYGWVWRRPPGWTWRQPPSEA